MKQVVLVGIGGFVGSVFRFVVVEWFGQWLIGFPAGTLVVNVTGSFVLGFLVSLNATPFAVPTEYRLFFGTGLLGAFTTFSAFSQESLGLASDGRWHAFAGNLFGSVAMGIAACIAGATLARVAAR